MKAKKNPKKAVKPVVVNWVHKPQEGAEQEFWRLYLKLGLEAVLESITKKKEVRDDRQDQA